MIKGVRIATAVLGGVLGAALAVSAPASAEEQDFTPIPVIKGIKSLETGSPAPDFTVKDLDGNMFTFSDQAKKKAHLILFWSIFCEPCREEMPFIQRIADEYRSGGALEVLAVNMDGEPFADGIKGFMNQYKYNVRVVLDELDAKGEEFAIADPYQVAGTPVIYLVDAQGRIAGSHLGRIADADLKALITAMLGVK